MLTRTRACTDSSARVTHCVSLFAASVVLLLGCSCSDVATPGGAVTITDVSPRLGPSSRRRPVGRYSSSVDHPVLG